MDDAEISRRLALAIGYKPKAALRNLAGGISVLRDASPQGYAVRGWYRFDYRDGETIWPIAERFDCFPTLWDGEGPEAWGAWCDAQTRFIYADTAAKAVALAVIKHCEGSKT